MNELVLFTGDTLPTPIDATGDQARMRSYAKACEAKTRHWRVNDAIGPTPNARGWTIMKSDGSESNLVELV
jgi:hypothetical protein